MAQQQLMDAIDEKQRGAGAGDSAGTGKTSLPGLIAKAVEALENGKVGRIVLSRPAVEAGESLGFLPGDLNEKLAPYLRPLYDALTERLGTQAVRSVCWPTALSRSRRWPICAAAPSANGFVVIDEAQNCT